MDIFGFIKGLFTSGAAIVDELNTSEEEKLTLRNKFAEIQAKVTDKVFSYQTKIAELENAVRIAELKSHHWLAANWRPMVAVFLVVNIVVMSWMGKNIPDAMSTLTNIFIPGYGGMRTAEKVMETNGKIKMGALAGLSAAAGISGV